MTIENEVNKMAERGEILMRVVVGIVSGIILGVWKAVVQIVAIINFFYSLIKGRRHKGMAMFCEIWNTQFYQFIKYMILLSNRRPFPFTQLERNMSTFER